MGTDLPPVESKMTIEEAKVAYVYIIDIELKGFSEPQLGRYRYVE